jgi:Kef-type K+ transport system membrane component KefB
LTNFELAEQFFLQVALILGVCRIVGLLAQRIGQPQVVGEMIAGIVLGPSLFGLVAPNLQQRLFPASSQPILYAVAQLGLVLYMFLIGTEFDVSLIRRLVASAASVSAAGILAPFVLGCAIAYFLARNHALFPPSVPVWVVMPFLGVAMSITAFPVLARILHERRMSGTALGTIALGAGSMGDALAWCLLALVLASFKADASVALLAIGGGALYVVGVLGVVRPLLRRLGDIVERKRGMSGPMLSFVLALVILGAWTSDKLGIYAVFGHALQRSIEPLCANVLLPLFFVFSGLNTRVALLDQPALWGIAALVLVAAVIGKGGGCWLAARLHGASQRDALALGSLMNARGLMELIALNIGLEQGVITPTLFTIMVIMAAVTTLMASPLFELVYRGERSPAALAWAERSTAPALSER